MNIDEYKELIKFHILFSECNLSEYNYAAVDKNGELWVYNNLPTYEEYIHLWEINTSTSATHIITLEPPIDAGKTLIKL